MFVSTNESDSDYVSSVLNVCFPFLGQDLENGSRLKAVARNTLASVIFHSKWLTDNLPENHPIFMSPLFAVFDLNRLRPLIYCGLPKVGGDLQATGVPANVSLRLEINDLKIGQKQIAESVGNLKQELSSSIREGMNTYAVSQGHLTYDALNDIISGTIKSLESRLEQQFSSNPTNLENDEPRPHSQQSLDDCLLPSNFVLPTKITVREAFILWHCGNNSVNLPPLFLAKLKNIRKKMKKRFSDLQVLMKLMVNEAKSQGNGDLPAWPQLNSGEFKNRLEAEETMAVFEKIKDRFELDPHTPKGRKRRAKSNSWTTVLKELRQRNIRTKMMSDERNQDLISIGNNWESVNSYLHSIYGYNEPCLMNQDTISHLNQLKELKELNTDIAPLLDLWIEKLSS